MEKHFITRCGEEVFPGLAIGKPSWSGVSSKTPSTIICLDELDYLIDCLDQIDEDQLRQIMVASTSGPDPGRNMFQVLSESCPKVKSSVNEAGVKLMKPVGCPHTPWDEERPVVGYGPSPKRWADSKNRSEAVPKTTRAILQSALIGMSPSSLAAFSSAWRSTAPRPFRLKASQQFRGNSEPISQTGKVSFVKARPNFSHPASRITGLAFDLSSPPIIPIYCGPPHRELWCTFGSQMPPVGSDRK
jgi:hypothetical protein